MRPGYPDKATLAFYFARVARQPRQDGIMVTEDKIFMHTRRRGAKGVLIVPADGSYLHFISNSWYE